MLNRTRMWAAAAIAVMAACGSQVSAQSKQTYTIDPSKVVHAVDSRIYGQFLEHIFNSVHGGLWGDMILNGGFVMHDGGGSWDVKDDMVYLTAPALDQRVILGDPNWTDYELTLDARKDSGGGEGFIVMFRVSGEQHYWMNFGGWGGSEHGLEKNRGPVKRVPGKIETGKWYRVRIRCEGKHIQAWLDDQPVIDLTDSDNAVLKGQIGLNTWGTKASFRNIKVTSLNGKVLLDRLPTRSEMSSAPPYWDIVGDGYCTFDKDDSPSGNGSIVMTCEEDARKVRLSSYIGTRTYLRQLPICFVKGETYKGRIYMKSPDSAHVRLITYDNHVFVHSEISPEWKAYDFEFVAEKSDPNSWFEVFLDGKGTVKVSNFTLFSKTALDNGGFRPDILKAIKDIQPATIRYPGGCFASGYRWKDAIGPHEKRKYYPGVIWADQDPNQMGTDEFMDLCERVGAEPILAINKGQGVQEALDWMEYCNGPVTSKWGKLRADNGHPKPYGVKYWEIDNEVWGMQPEDYAKDVKLFSEALKARDPKAIIIACGCYAYDTGVGEGGKENWNKRLLDNAAPYFDYLSIHYYNGICVDQDYVQDPRRYEAFMRDEIGGLIKQSKNPKIRIYCSEWGQMNAEWRSGLYTAGVLNAFERQSDIVPMTCPAVWMQSISADKPNPRWASCQILYDHTKFVPAPEYVVEKLWRDNLGASLVKMDGPSEPLNACATVSADKKTLYFKVVNPTKEPCDVELKLAKGVAKSASMTIVNPGAENARNTLDKPDVVRSEQGNVTVKGSAVTCNLPALSAAVVKVTLK